ncbi:MAG: MarR family transcriptional regulator [Spirochaetes bacterium]|nr:MAG: MarR family transcriptional regulator [Spirochaetota bacterium]
MSLTLVELIDVLTRFIGDQELHLLKELEASGLTARQLYYLETIREMKNPTYGELARRLALSKPSVTAAVEKLAGLGYVQRIQSDEDRRSFHLHVTDKAETLSGLHREGHERIAHLLSKNLDAKDLAQMVRILNKVIQGT